MLLSYKRFAIEARQAVQVMFCFSVSDMMLPLASLRVILQKFASQNKLFISFNSKGNQIKGCFHLTKVLRPSLKLDA